MMRDQGLWFWHVAAAPRSSSSPACTWGIMHLDAILGIGNPAGGHPIDWANVVARGKSAAFLVSYVLLLGRPFSTGFTGSATFSTSSWPRAGCAPCAT